MESKDTTNTSNKRPSNLAQLMDEVRSQSHMLAEHATIIFTRSELALEEAKEENHALRTHLTAIHQSAGTVSESSKKLRRLVSA
jgi:hypothetical protein